MFQNILFSILIFKCIFKLFLVIFFSSGFVYFEKFIKPSKCFCIFFLSTNFFFFLIFTYETFKFYKKREIIYTMNFFLSKHFIGIKPLNYNNPFESNQNIYLFFDSYLSQANINLYQQFFICFIYIKFFLIIIIYNYI